VQDILNHSEKYNVGGFMAFLDFKKAFDSLEWNFMFEVLKKYNFGESFRKWVAILYNEPVSCIKNNGWISNIFKIERGIKQGCPLSALLFIISIEILAIVIRKDQELSGYNFRLQNISKEIRISQYADDITLFLKNEDQIPCLLNKLDSFGKLSGLILNKNKTKLMPLGKDKSANIKDLDISFEKDMVKYLGLFIGHNKKKCEYKNWNEKINKIEKLIVLWSKHNMTIFGKVTIIKSLLLPKFTFLASHMIVPQWVSKRLETIFYKFLWQGKDKIKRNVAIAKIQNGGLNMIDINSHFKSLKAKWILRIVEAQMTDPKWVFLSKCYFNSCMLFEIIDKINIETCDTFDDLKNIPQFYKECIAAFSVSNPISSPTNTDELLNLSLWGNPYIRNKNGNMLYFKEWIEAKIIYVKDIFLIMEN
jgi:hypothetical protein